MSKPEHSQFPLGDTKYVNEHGLKVGYGYAHWRGPTHRCTLARGSGIEGRWGILVLAHGQHNMNARETTSRNKSQSSSSMHSVLACVTSAGGTSRGQTSPQQIQPNLGVCHAQRLQSQPLGPGPRGSSQTVESETRRLG
jgi:hypothetical protein